MKMIFGLLLVVSATVSFANDKEAYAKMATQCFDEASVQVSIGLSQAAHQAENGSVEHTAAVLRQQALGMLIDVSTMTLTQCKNNEQTRLDCIIDSRAILIDTLIVNFDAEEEVAMTKACELID